MVSSPDVVTEGASADTADGHRRGLRQSSRCQLGVDLSKHVVLAASLQKPRWYKWRSAFPNMATVWRTQELFNLTTQLWWQLPKQLKVSTAHHGNLKITGTALCPRPAKRSDGSLGCISQPHRGVDDDMIKMAISIQIDWDGVCVFVVVLKWPIEVVLSGKFRTGHALAIAEATDNGSVEQFRLRQCSSDGRQGGSIPVWGRDGQEDRRHSVNRVGSRRCRNSNL